MKDLSLVDPLPAEYKARADEIYDLPGCRRVVGLPDGGMSNHETPYGIAAAFRDYVVPQLIGRVVSCGMGLIKIDVDASELAGRADAIAVELAERIGARRSRFRIDPGLANRLYTIGPQSLLDRMPELEDRVEPRLWESAALEPFLDKPRRIEDLIAPWVLKSEKSWQFPGARIRKNHFIELAEGVKHDSIGEQASSDSGSTFCAYHFETPLSSAVNAAYSGTRRKERTNGAMKHPRTWIRYARKARFHLSVERSRALQSWGSFLRHSDFVPIAIESSPGQRFLSVLQLITNYERAARIAFAVTIIEALEAVLRHPLEWRLIFESGHNGFESELVDGERHLVSRKNLVRADSSEVGFIAGMYNMPSLLVRPRQGGGGPRWLNSYDHGIGNHLWRDVGREAYESTLKVGDLSQYERSLRIAPPELTAGGSSDRTNLGECSVFRYGVGRAQKEVHQVVIGPSIQHVIDVYGNDDSPVEVIGLLAPFLNIKEAR